jgi:hypothetical protein
VALEQIEKERYDERLRQEGYQNIVKYGLAFYRKECLVKKLRMYLCENQYFDEI